MVTRRERFIPDVELKTIEIDVKNKIFRVNGRDFGKDAKNFYLRCHTSPNDGEWWQVELGINTIVTYLANYDIEGKQTSAEERISGSPYEDGAAP